MPVGTWIAVDILFDVFFNMDGILNFVTGYTKVVVPVGRGGERPGQKRRRTWDLAFVTFTGEGGEGRGAIMVLHTHDFIPPIAVVSLYFVTSFSAGQNLFFACAHRMVSSSWSRCPS